MPVGPTPAGDPRRRDQADYEASDPHSAMPGRAAAAVAGATAVVAAGTRVAPLPRPPPPPPPPPPLPLAHASFGVSSPTAPLVFFNHGWPGSRLGAAMLHRAALKLGVRVVGVDRPGFGGTPFCAASHGFESWAHRLAALADQLGARRYAVLGVSGGGPFALAAARHAPQPERVAGLGLLCPVAPPTAPAAAAPGGAKRRAGAGCFSGGCVGGGGVAAEGEGNANSSSSTSTTTATTASWALRAAERHPRTARVALLVARALLASSSSTVVSPAAAAAAAAEAEAEAEAEAAASASHSPPPPPPPLPWTARLLQRAAMGAREADAGGEAPHAAAAADIWRAVAEGLRGGGRGMLHEIRLVSRAGGAPSSSLSSPPASLSSCSSAALWSLPPPSLPRSSPPGSPLAPSASPELQDGGQLASDLLFLGGGGGGGGGSCAGGGGTAAAAAAVDAPFAAAAPPFSQHPQQQQHPPPYVAFCWHGTEDKVAPLPLAEHYYGRLAGCEFRAFEGETHTSLVLGRLGDALAELVQRGAGGGSGGHH